MIVLSNIQTWIYITTDIVLMGNEPQSKKEGQVTLNVNHPKFQKARVISEGRQRRLQFSMGADQQEYEKWKHTLDVAHLSPTYLLLPVHDEFARKGLCGDTGTLQLSFENYPYLLSEEIYNRRGRHSKFEETQLWYLLFILCAAQQEVKRKNVGKVGDVRPQNVFLNAEGEAKVSCTLSWPREGTNFSKTFDSEPTYLAPQDMERLEMGTLQDSHSHQGEIFSIGMTVLSAAMLEDFLPLYNPKTYRFDTQQCSALLKEWQSNTVYSQIFTGLINNLCRFQPQRRIDNEELWKWLWQFEKQIKRKEDFVIEYAPPKIDQQIEEIRQLYPVEVEHVPEMEVYPPGYGVQPGYGQKMHEQVIPIQQQQMGYPDRGAQQGISQQMHDHVMPFQQQQQQISFPDRSVVESYHMPPNVSSPRGFFQQGHQTLPPQAVYQREMPSMPSPRGQQLPPNARYTEQPFARPPPQIKEFQPPVGQYQYQANEDNYLPQEVRGNLPPQIAARLSAQGQQRTPQRFVNYEGTHADIDKRYITDSPPQSQGSRQVVYRQGPVQGQGPEFGGQAAQGQLPPQFVGRTVKETYIGQEGEGKIMHQGYIPSFGPEAGPPMNHPNNLSYFQNMIDPQGAKGGRIQETVYIQRPSDYSNIARYQ